MTAEARVWRVAVIGLNSNGLFLLEQFGLIPNIQVTGVFDADRVRRTLALPVTQQVWDQPDVTRDDVDVLILNDNIPYQLVLSALRARKHVVLDRVWSFTSHQLCDATELAAGSGCSATFLNHRRTSSDFSAAQCAKSTGRLGNLQSVRMSSCEQAVPGETIDNGLREIGFAWLDQLLMLVESTVQSVFAKRLTDLQTNQESGFVAVIEFANGCTARIEVQTSSRLSIRSGWMLEGSAGSYRGNRLYVTTEDREIVDQPFTGTAPRNHDLIESLTNAWQGQPSSAATLADAARVVRLIELLEQSADTGQVVKL